MKALIVAVACVTALVLPGGALAAKCAPPGNSGVNQYFETIPGANCNQTHVGSGGGPTGGGKGGSLPASTGRALVYQGATGKAVENLVASTGTRTGHHSRSGSSGSSAGGAANPIVGLLHPILTGSASGGLGILLPLLLVGAAILVLATALLRRRRVGRMAGE